MSDSFALETLEHAGSAFSPGTTKLVSEYLESATLGSASVPLLEKEAEALINSLIAETKSIYEGIESIFGFHK